MDLVLNKTIRCNVLVQKAVENNKNADAQNNIGYIYHHGQVIEINYDLALYFYTKSAELGNIEASTNIDTLHHDRLSSQGPQNKKEPKKFGRHLFCIVYKEMEPITFFHVEDTRSATTCKKLEPRKLFHVEDMSVIIPEKKKRTSTILVFVGFISLFDLSPMKFYFFILSNNKIIIYHHLCQVFKQLLAIF